MENNKPIFRFADRAIVSVVYEGVRFPLGTVIHSFANTEGKGGMNQVLIEHVADVTLIPGTGLGKDQKSRFCVWGEDYVHIT